MQTVLNQSLSHEEAFSAIISMRSFPELVSILTEINFPPLWNICQWIIFNYLGNDEVYIRGLTITFSILSAIFTYKIGSFLWSKKTGFIAALLTLTNPLLFAYAFEAEAYSIIILSVSASIYYFLRIFYNEERVRRRDKIGYVFSNLLSLYSSQATLAIIIVHSFWGIYEIIFGKRARAKKLFKLNLTTLIGYIPWFILTYNLSREMYSQLFEQIPRPVDIVNFFFNYYSGNILYKEIGLPLLNVGLFQFSLYLLAATLVLRKWWKSIKKTIILLLILCIPALLTWFLLYKITFTPIDNYLIYTLPVITLIISSSRSKFSIIPIILLLMIFTYTNYIYFTNPSKPEFNKLTEHIKSELKESDLIINNYQNNTHHLWETKYYDISAPIYIPSEGVNLPFFAGTALMEKSDVIHEIPEKINKIAVITDRTIEVVNFPSYTESESKTFGNLKLILYEKDKDTD